MQNKRHPKAISMPAVDAKKQLGWLYIWTALLLVLTIASGLLK